MVDWMVDGVRNQDSEWLSVLFGALSVCGNRKEGGNIPLVASVIYMGGIYSERFVIVSVFTFPTSNRVKGSKACTTGTVVRYRRCDETLTFSDQASDDALKVQHYSV